MPYIPVLVAVLVGLIHTPDRIYDSYDSVYAMHVIVQLIGDNSRTLHVLLAFDCCSISHKRHVFDANIPVLATVSRVGHRWPTDEILSQVFHSHTIFICRPQIKRDYPLNLSI